MNCENKPKVSVIVPIYNKASFLEKSINSILQQTEKNIEIILVDDGSTDNSPEICERFVKENSRIIFKRKENQGPMAARNYGRKFANGDYISFVDSDDFIEANACEQMLKCSNNADIVLSGLIHEFGNKKILQTMPENLAGFYENSDIRNAILPLFLVYGKGIGKNLMFAHFGIALFKRTFLEEYGIAGDERITYSEDWLFFFEALMKAKSVAIEHNAYYHYAHNAQGLTENYSPKLALDYVEVLRKLDKMSIDYSNLAYNYLLQSIMNLSISEESIFILRKKARDILNMDYFNCLGKNINPANISIKKRMLFYLVKFKLSFLLVLLYKLKYKFCKLAN